MRRLIASVVVGMLWYLAGGSASEPEGEQPTCLPNISAEVLFSGSLLGDGEESGFDEKWRLMQLLLKEIKDIEAGRRSVDAPSGWKRQTALMQAAVLEHRLAVAWLIAKGADASLRDRSGKLALDYAKDDNIRELLLVCMHENAPLNEEEIEQFDSLGSDGDHDEAVRTRLWDSVNWPLNVGEVADLLKYGADANGFRRGKLIIENTFLQPETLAWLVRRGYDVNVRTQDGKSPFCVITRPDVLKLLLALGMQIDAQDVTQQKLLWNLLQTNATPQEESGEKADARQAAQPHVEVYFDSIHDRLMPWDFIEASLCASGHLFTGRMELWDEYGRCVVVQEVQTGGWMSRNSPFRRQGNYPRNTKRGSYTPSQYPDTAFPVLEEPTTLDTEQTTALHGYRIPDPPGTGRTGLMIHSSERLGSEGCISASGGIKWAIFCAKMKHFRDMGLESIPLSVHYLCTPPEPNRRAKPTKP